MTMWRCKTCNVCTPTESLLRAPSPFNPEDELLACPSCKHCDEGFDEMCDEPGCARTASSGWKPKDQPYRRTCGEHMGVHHWNRP
jgi:hypothetical protein